MNNTILCNFSTVNADNLSRPFLKKISFIRPGGLSTLGLVQIEFTEPPKIIQQLRLKAESEGREQPIFTIDSISEYGVVLNTVGSRDETTVPIDYFYIPTHCIACIHTVDTAKFHL